MPFTGSSNVRFKMVSMMILTDIMTDEENMKLEDKSGKCMTPRLVTTRCMTPWARISHCA